MSVEKKRYSPSLIVALTEFLSESRIEEYLNTTLKKFLYENAEIRSSLGDVPLEFKVQVVPISLLNVPIPNERGIIEEQKYLDFYLKEEADKFMENELSENPLWQDNFRRIKRDRFLVDLRVTYEKNKFKKVSGKTFIYCNNPVVINILSRKTPEGEDFYKREYKTNLETGLLYTEDVVTDYIKNNAPKEVVDIYIEQYRPMPIENYPNYFNYYSNQGQDSDVARFELCGIFKSFLDIIKGLSTNGTIPDDYSIFLSSAFDRFIITQEVVNDLFNLYRRGTRNKMVYFASTGIFASKLNNVIKNHNLSIQGNPNVEELRFDFKNILENHGKIKDRILGIEHPFTEVLEMGNDGEVIHHLRAGGAVEGGEPA